ncbi:MAG TPA: succinylglutamate desuccinylase/aspartoacylase family protein [Candidatus Polarisedimenticolia bacterium]|nr:succinylglutamate desuccinylase/aspartoacylase family protein [Candidatus Polarisedimenticolia bacterium]
MAEELKIGGKPVNPGEAQEILLKISEFYTAQPVNIQVTVIRGLEEGPRVFLTAAIHGDELNGVEIVRTIMSELEPARVRGTVLCIPVLNRWGFLSHSRYLPGRRDLNRYFPGSAEGNLAERVAHKIFMEIVQRSECGIDMHTASVGRTNLAHVRGDMGNEKVRKMAKAFGTEIIVDRPTAGRTLRSAATRSGIPTIILEAGETFRFQRPMVTKGVIGVKNVLADLGMIDWEVQEPRFQVIVKVSEWIRAERGGILDIQVRPGHLLYEGDEIAVVSTPFGREVTTLRSPLTGLVIGITTIPLVQPGDAICHIAKLEKTLPTVEKHSIEDGKGRRCLALEEK